MDLDFLHTKDKENSKTNSFFDSFVQELRRTLNKKQSLVIDRFEGNMAVCENQDNGKMVDISKDLIVSEATEGMTIKLEDNRYVIDYENCIITRKNIIDELKKTWQKEDGAEYYVVSSVLEKAVKCSNIFMKQNIYIKDEEFMQNVKKCDIIKYVDDEYIIDKEKNDEINLYIQKRRKI